MKAPLWLVRIWTGGLGCCAILGEEAALICCGLVRFADSCGAELLVSSLALGCMCCGAEIEVTMLPQVEGPLKSGPTRRRAQRG